ncbi:MAG TPA: DCC1-like thiol-disulfide oxidoreductase family protein, partial [Phycisphaeraceae bacterium]
VPLIIGCKDRWAAAGLLAVWLVLLVLMPEQVLTWPQSAQTWPLLALLAIHLLTPPAPYGSWDARGRAHPAGPWRLPAHAHALAWAALAIFYLNLILSPTPGSSPPAPGSFPSESFPQAPPQAPPLASGQAASISQGVRWLLTLAAAGLLGLAIHATTRPWGWLIALVIGVPTLAALGLWQLAGVLLLLHLFTFNPAWLPGRKATAPQPASEPEHLFYDGHCGLCHRWVRLVLAEDRTGGVFVLSPLQGDYIRQRLSDEQRQGLPDSIVVQRADGRLLTRSTAIFYILARLGGLWRLIAWALWLIPRPLRDAGYDAVAALRHRIFPRPDEACPLMPPQLRSRFRM